MSLIPQQALPDSFPPYEAFRQNFGFVPEIFRAQSLLPRVIEAEAQIAGAVLLAPGALTRVQKETILLTLASRRAAGESAYSGGQFFDVRRRVATDHRYSDIKAGTARSAVETYLAVVHWAP